jgi:hypothetical protein
MKEYVQEERKEGLMTLTISVLFGALEIVVVLEPP